jgi:ATP-dependent DNA helicase 2 subunit 2
MFVIDISPSMGTVTTVDVLQPDGEVQQLEMTHLERAIQFVKLKIQDLVSLH